MTVADGERRPARGGLAGYRIYNPRRLVAGQRVDVLDRGRYLAATVEAPRAFGWVLVKGMRGRDGVASVRASAVRVQGGWK